MPAVDSTAAGADSSLRPCAAARRELVDRRAATWRWQRTLGVAKSSTRHPERWVRGCAYVRWLKALWAQRADQLWRTWSRLQWDVEFAIEWVFPAAEEAKAKAVAWCESKFSRRAQNGQYFGVWQMGSSERERFGHSTTAIGQTLAAKRYFDLSGWSPWSCA